MCYCLVAWNVLTEKHCKMTFSPTDFSFWLIAVLIVQQLSHQHACREILQDFVNLKFVDITAAVDLKAVKRSDHCGRCKMWRHMARCTFLCLETKAAAYQPECGQELSACSPFSPSLKVKLNYFIFENLTPSKKFSSLSCSQEIPWLAGEGKHSLQRQASAGLWAYTGKNMCTVPGTCVRKSLNLGSFESLYYHSWG